MQSVSINHIEYKIPLSWEEVKYSQAIAVIKNLDDKAEQLKALSGIDADIINALSDREAQSLFTLISFTEDLSPFERNDVLDKYKDFDFGNVSFLLSEKVRTALNKDIIGLEASVEIIKILKGEDISDEPFLDVIGSANFFLSNTLIFTVTIPNLNKIYSATNKSERVPSDSIVLEHLRQVLKLHGLAG